MLCNHITWTGQQCQGYQCSSHLELPFPSSCLPLPPQHKSQTACQSCQRAPSTLHSAWPRVTKNFSILTQRSSSRPSVYHHCPQSSRQGQDTLVQPCQPNQSHVYSHSVQSSRLGLSESLKSLDNLISSSRHHQCFHFKRL